MSSKLSDISNNVVDSVVAGTDDDEAPDEVNFFFLFSILHL